MYVTRGASRPTEGAPCSRFRSALDARMRRLFVTSATRARARGAGGPLIIKRERSDCGAGPGRADTCGSSG